MNHDKYEEELKTLQRELLRLQQAMARDGLKGILVLEGWDAAGKGGLIRRIAWALDPRRLKVWQIGAPTQREADAHWMRRFWTKIPDAGEIAIFDRSWYGRVLVERVEGFATEQEWTRAYQEIANWERSLTNEGYRICKLFLDISPDEQLSRLMARYRNPEKRWKLTEEDIRNRSRWSEYETAYKDMIDKTSTDWAPWHRIDANSKRAARLEGMREMLKLMGAGVDLALAEPPDMVRAYFEEVGRSSPG